MLLQCYQKIAQLSSDPSVPAQWRSFLVTCGTALSDVGRELDQAQMDKAMLQHRMEVWRVLGSTSKGVL